MLRAALAPAAATAVALPGAPSARAPVHLHKRDAAREGRRHGAHDAQAEREGPGIEGQLRDQQAQERRDDEDRQQPKRDLAARGQRRRGLLAPKLQALRVGARRNRGLASSIA